MSAAPASHRNRRTARSTSSRSPTACAGRSEPRSAGCRSRSAAESRSGWWASPAAVNRPWRSPWFATCRATAGSRAARSPIDGRNPYDLSESELRTMRANTVSMVYQDASRALNPSMQIGRQVAEVFEVGGASRKEAVERSEAALARVRISDPRNVMDRFPHQLSGGMQQRVDYRHGAGRRAGTADPGRADHRPRRDGRGRGARSGVGAARGALDLAALHQPQPRRDRQDVRPRGRAVRRRDGRAGARRSEVFHDPRHPVHGRASALHPAAGPAQGGRLARHHPRVPAGAGCRHRGVHLRRPLRPGAGSLPHRSAADVPGGSQPRVSLPFPRAGTDACRTPPEATSPMPPSAPSSRF